MYDNLYNILILTFFFLSIKKINDIFFKLNQNFYFTIFLYHLVITAFYITIFKNGAADYKTYLNLTTFDGFTQRAYVSSDLVVSFIALLKLVLYFNDITIIYFFLCFHLLELFFFYKNLIILGVTKQFAQLLVFIPSIHFWTCTPGKDSLLFALLALFFYLYLNKNYFFPFLLIFFIFFIKTPCRNYFFFPSILFAEFFVIKGYKKVTVILLF